MAGFPMGKVFSLRLLGQKRQTSMIFLRKIFQALAKNNIVHSHRGVAGGFSLAKDPSQISIRQIIESVQDPLTLNECLTGDYHCLKERTCVLRKYLAGVQKDLVKKFQGLTLKSLATQQCLLEEHCV